jgi:hypothetical protein
VSVSVPGIVARGKGQPVSLETIVVPDPGPRARPGYGSRPVGSATPTCTTGKAASTTSSRFYSATRQRASLTRSVQTSPRSLLATS